MRLAHIAIGIAVALGMSPAPAADAPRFSVDIEAPAPYDGLLRRNLDLTRRIIQAQDEARDDAGQRELSIERLRHLARDAADDAKRILETEGYYEAIVSTVIDDLAQPPRIRLEAALGPRTQVAEVAISFQGAIATADAALEPAIKTLRTRWSMPTGRAFRHEDWEAAKQALLRELSFNRYPRARIVSSEALIDTIRREARLALEIDSGPPFVFGSLQISGLSHYPASVIERLQPPEPGEVYSQRRLADFQSRVQRLPYFANVVVTAAPVEDESSGIKPATGAGTDTAGTVTAVPVRIELVEASRKRIDLGVGYSTDTGARAQAGYTDLDLFGLGWRWRNLLKLEQRQQSLTTEIAFPRTGDGYEHDIGTGLIRTDVQNFATRSLTFNAKRARLDGRVERAWTMFATFSEEQAAGEEAAYKKAVVPGYAWRYRALDNPIDPRRGYDLTLAVGGASKAVFSDQNFIRTFGRLSAIYDLTPTDSLVGRVEGGVMFAPSRESIPLALLFRAGGEQSVRGYAYQSIGVPEGRAIGGGRYLAIGGIEYIRWLVPTWGGAVFYEAGDAFDDRRKFDPKAGYGIGARWRSPAGPLNMDLAYGQAVHRVRFHLSVGFVF